MRELPTPQQVKASGVLGKCFFSYRTMMFFGQIMSDFETKWVDEEKGIFVLRGKSSLCPGYPTIRELIVTENGVITEKK